MKKIKLTFFGLIIILFTGCATSSFTQTGETYPEYHGIVKVFAEAPQNLEYVQVGLVSSKGGNIHSTTDMIKALQKEAAEHGANAIILISNEETQGYVASQYYTGTTTAKEMTAIAIRILEK